VPEEVVAEQAAEPLAPEQAVELLVLAQQELLAPV
jgi:hypothetical protein